MTGTDFLCPVSKGLNHIPLHGRGLDNLRVEVSLWNRQHEHICRLDIRNHLEGGHQFRQVVELGKPGLAPVAAALRGQLNGGDGFSIVCRPVIEVQQSHFFQGAVLQIPLDGIQLYHTVRDRGAGGEDDTTVAGDLVQILALHKQIRGLLCFRLGDTAHIPHFCREEQILKKMALIHENAVNAQLLKGYHIVLAALVVQLGKPVFQRFPGAFHLLDRIILRMVPLGFPDAVQDAVDLPPKNDLLPLF